MRLIDTDKLLEKTECLFKDLNSTEDYMGIGYNHGVGDSIAIIKNAPTIEAEPVKHGEWRDYPIADGCLQCSICGVLRIGGPSNFCPNFGAKMDAEEGEEA